MAAANASSQEETGSSQTMQSGHLPGNKWLWLLPILAGIIFTSGLFYSFSVSRNNSRHLIQLQEQTYPVLENVSLLKAELKSIQTGFYYAAAAMDMDELVRMQENKTQFLGIIDQLKALFGDRESLISIQSLFEEYFQLSEKLSVIYIENRGHTDSTRTLIDQVREKGALLTEAVQNLNEAGVENFKTALKESEENSFLILNANLISAIIGMFLMIAFSIWIVLLNTRLISANQDLESANRNLDHQVKSRTQELESFVYTVSHDLKSPVVSMQGMASMLLQNHNKELNEKARHYVDRIIFNANYMEELILGLLTLSRIGRSPKALKTAEVREVLDEILTLHKEDLRRKKIEVIIEPSLPHFSFDHLHLTQIFQNLITNAAKFMGEQPRPKIEIGGREEEAYVEFHVKDNGIGIDPSYHEKIFGIFQRLKEVEVEGTGVGLSIVKKIIDLAGGRIWIESKKGSGAAFLFQLPRKDHPG